MAQRRSLAWTEVRVGVLVITSFVLLAAAVFFVGGASGIFTDTYTVKVYFSSANGLRKGGEVWLEGVTIGNVGSVRISSDPDPNRSVEVELELDSGYQSYVKSDSNVSVGTIGLLGDKYVDITRGSTGGTVIVDGGTLQGTEAGDIKQIIQGTNDFVANLAELSDQIKKMSDKVDRGEGNLGKLLNDTTMYDSINATIREANGMIVDARSGSGTIGRLISDRELYDGIIALTKRMDTVAGRFDNLAASIERGEGTAGKFLKDPELYNNANRLVGQVQGVVDRIERGEGTLGKLSKDDALYTDLRKTTADLQETLNHVSSVVTSIENGQGTIGKLIKEDKLYNSLNETTSEMQKLIYDIRQDPKKYLTIIFKLF